MGWLELKQQFTNKHQTKKNSTNKKINFYHRSNNNSIRVSSGVKALVELLVKKYSSVWKKRSNNNDIKPLFMIEINFILLSLMLSTHPPPKSNHNSNTHTHTHNYSYHLKCPSTLDFTIVSIL